MNTLISKRIYLCLLLLMIWGTFTGCVSFPKGWIYDYGVTCIEEADGVLYALIDGSHSIYMSMDGGVTWQQQSEAPIERSGCPLIFDMFSLSFSSDEDLTNADGNHVSYDLSRYQLPVREAYHNRQDENTRYIIGPVDAEIDPNTGNLVMAMSLDGVLVITPEGEQIWAGVNEYTYVELTDGDRFALIDGAYILALFLFALVGIIFTSGSKRIYIVILCLIWAFWIVFALSYRISESALSGSFIPTVLFIIYSILVGSLGYQWQNRRGVIVSVLLLSFAIALIYLLPFALWLEGRLAKFGHAVILSVVLTIISTVLANYRIRKRYFAKANSHPRKRDLQRAKHNIDDTINPFESE